MEDHFEKKFKELWYYYFDVFFLNKDFRKQVEFGFANLKKAKVITSKIPRNQVFDKLYCIWNHYNINLDMRFKYKKGSHAWRIADRALIHIISVMDVLITGYHYLIEQKINNRNITLA